MTEKRDTAKMMRSLLNPQPVVCPVEHRPAHKPDACLWRRHNGKIVDGVMTPQEYLLRYSPFQAGQRLYIKEVKPPERVCDERWYWPILYEVLNGTEH